MIRRVPLSKVFMDALMFVANACGLMLPVGSRPGAEGGRIRYC